MATAGMMPFRRPDVIRSCFSPLAVIVLVGACDARHDRKQELNATDSGASLPTRDRLVDPPETLPKDVIGRVIRSHWKDIKPCYDRQAALGDRAQGNVTV